MKRITILLILAALLSVSAGALSIEKKSIRKVARKTQVVNGSDYQKAMDAYDKDDLNTAAALMKKHLDKHPNDAESWACLAGIYGEAGKSQEAMKAIDRARQCNISESDTELLNWLYFTRSGINLQLHDTISAIEDLNMALRYDKTDVDSYFRRANIYKRLRRFDEAMVDYGMVIQYEPKEVQGYLGLGTVAGSLKKRKEAIKAYTMAIKLEPEQPECYALRAVEYFNDWDYEKAAKDVVTALELDRENTRALWILEYLKQTEDASKDLNKVFNDKAKKTKDPTWLDLLKD